MATDDLPISTPPLPQPRRLVDVLRGLSEKELKTLIQRVYAKIDPAKRIDVPSQLARTLLVLPEVRDPSLLPRPTFELLHRIAEEKGGIGIQEEAETGTVISARLMQLADDIRAGTITTASAIAEARRLIDTSTRRP